MFSQPSLLKVCFLQTNKPVQLAGSYDVLLRNKMLYAVAVAAPLAESMLNID